ARSAPPARRRCPSPSSRSTRRAPPGPTACTPRSATGRSGRSPGTSDSWTDVRPAAHAALCSRVMPTIVLLTEDALRPSDVENITTLHGADPLTVTVLVPADTERNVVTDFIDHLSLLELREAWDAITEKDDDVQARQ